MLQLVHDGYKTGRVVKVAISMPPRENLLQLLSFARSCWGNSKKKAS